MKPTEPMPMTPHERDAGIISLLPGRQCPVGWHLARRHVGNGPCTRDGTKGLSQLLDGASACSE
jgi:hypothetical protein